MGFEHTSGATCSRYCLILGVVAFSTGAGCLRNVILKAPYVVPVGGTAVLMCSYDLEGDPLYTVKWYKVRQEFFRYVPKELPPTRVFPLPGVSVNIGASGSDKVVLEDVSSQLSGKYRCEVSTDAPDFETVVVSAQMHVISPIEGNPKLLLEKGSYSQGDTIKANCSSPEAHPALNLSWYLNGQKVLPTYVSQSGNDSSAVTVIGLTYELDASDFRFGKLRLSCVADLYGIFSSSAETLLHGDKPRLAPVLGTRESSGYRQRAAHQSYFLVLVTLVAKYYMSLR